MTSSPKPDDAPFSSTTAARTEAPRSLALAYVLTTVVTVVLLAAGVIAYHLQGGLRTSLDAWQEYNRHRQERLSWLHDLRVEMGFGGLVHHYQTYLHSGDETVAYRAERSVRRLMQMIDQRQSLADPAEAPHLATIRQGLDQYQVRLSMARAVWASGGGHGDVWAVGTLDTTALQGALNRLESLVAIDDAETSDRLNDQFRVLEEMRVLIAPLFVVTVLAALGVIGLIRRFGQEIRRREGSEQQVRQFTGRLLEEIEMARMVQEDLLPTRQQINALSARTGLHISSRLRPSTELSGDFWTTIDLGDGRVAVLLADMTGHGLVAAMNGLRMTDVVIRSTEYFVINAGHLLNNLSDDLTRVLPEGHFAAAALVLYEPGRGEVQLAGAAFPPPLLCLHDSGTVEAVRLRGLPLGIDEGARYETVTRPLDGACTLLLYSDALIETPDASGQVLTEDEIAAWLWEAIRYGAGSGEDESDIAGLIIEQALKRLGDDLPDDLTVVAVTIPAPIGRTPPDSGLSALISSLDDDVTGTPTL